MFLNLLATPVSKLLWYVCGDKSSAVTWLIDASNGEDVKDNNEEDEELEDERNAEEEDAADGVRKDESSRTTGGSRKSISSFCFSLGLSAFR